MSGEDYGPLKGVPEPLTAEQSRRFLEVDRRIGRAAAVLSDVKRNGLRGEPELHQANCRREALEAEIGEFQAALQMCINAGDLDEGEIGLHRRRAIARAHKLHAVGGA